LARPLAIKSLPRSLGIVARFQRSQTVAEFEQAPQAKVKAHVRQGPLPPVGQLTPPRQRLIQLAPHPANVVFQQIPRLFFGNPDIFDVAANANGQFLSGAAIRARAHAFIVNQFINECFNVHDPYPLV
jgi:hypothetical protein